MSCPYFTLIEMNRGSNKEPLWLPKVTTNAKTVRRVCSARLSPSLDSVSIQISSSKPGRHRLETSRVPFIFSY